MSEFANEKLFSSYGLKHQSISESPAVIHNGINAILLYKVRSNWARLSSLLNQIDKFYPCIGVGFAGSLSEDDTRGQYIAPIAATNGKNVGGAAGITDTKLTEKIVELLSESTVSYGKVYTVNDIVDENKQLIEKLVSENYTGVDMETSFFLSYLNEKKIPCTAILVVSDNIRLSPLDPKNKGGNLPLNGKTIISAQKAIIAACRSLLEN